MIKRVVEHASQDFDSTGQCKEKCGVTVGWVKGVGRNATWRAVQITPVSTQEFLDTGGNEAFVLVAKGKADKKTRKWVLDNHPDRVYIPHSWVCSVMAEKREERKQRKADWEAAMERRRQERFTALVHVLAGTLDGDMTLAEEAANTLVETGWVHIG